MDKEQLLGLLDQCTMYEVQEETTKNWLIFDELKHILKQHGFDIGLNKLEGMDLPVTKFGRSRNDHCIIHKNFYMAQRMKFGYIAGTNNYAITQTSVSAAADVVECKSDTYAIEQIAEMIRTMGSAALPSFSKDNHIHVILIAGLAVNYSTRESKYIRLTVNFNKGQSHIQVSKDNVPFNKAILKAIQY